MQRRGFLGAVGVAGAAALMLERDPSLNPASVKARLMRSARRDPEHDPYGDPFAFEHIHHASNGVKVARPVVRSTYIFNEPEPACRQILRKLSRIDAGDPGFSPASNFRY